MTKPSDLNSDQRALFDVWRSLGLSESSAMNALREDGQLEVSGFDAATDMFRNVFGLSEAGARVAAQGRNFTDFGGSAADGTPAGEWAEKARRTLAEMSDAECDALVAEQKRRRPPVKAAVKGSAPAPVRKPPGRRLVSGDG